MLVFTDISERTETVSASRIIAGIAASRNLAVVCGAGVSVMSGIPDFRSEGGLWNQVLVQSQSGRFRIKGSELFTNYASAEGERLRELNKLMVTLRISARTAPLSPFHVFLHRGLDEGRIAACLTRNFDGLETRDRPDLASRVTMLHGDNRILSCRNPTCMGIDGEEAASFDQSFLSGEPVICPSCASQRLARQKAGKRSAIPVQELRPAVLLDERLDPDLQAGYLHDELLKVARRCDTLLVVATTLKGDSYDLIHDIARVVHEEEGVVIYVDYKELKPARYRETIDYHLRMDVQTCARAIMEAMDLNKPETASDIWVELSEHLLVPESSAQVPNIEVPFCCQCGMTIDDVITPCIRCGTYYCFETPDTRDARMCVLLDYFGTRSTTLQTRDRLESFVCFECHDHESSAYPHFIRETPRFYRPPEHAPRLVLLVYYLAQFWPIAEHMMGSISSVWKANGWACYCTPVRLQSLDMKDELLNDCLWEPGTYNAMVVYVTHGTSGQRLYQLGDNEQVNPAQVGSLTSMNFGQLITDIKFLGATLRPAQRVLKNAAFSCAYLLTCGHVYDSPENVSSIQGWLNNNDLLHCVVGTMNKRLIPAYTVNLISQSAGTLLGHTRWTRIELLDLWLRDNLACTHTDLLYFARNEQPRLFCFSPFQSRPLGKDLPSLLSSCSCSSAGQDSHGLTPRRKIWKVQHDGQHGSDLKDVVVKAQCSLCKKLWHLRQPDLPGKLHKYGGLYAAEVPYFMD